MAELKNIVFVYGTLQRGLHSHVVFERFGEKVKFLGEVETLDPYPFVLASSLNAPFLLDDKGSGKLVQGELYSCTDEVLTYLDDFEGHPRIYERKEVSVKFLKEEGLDPPSTYPVTCWGYLLTNYRPELLELPMVVRYDAELHSKLIIPEGYKAGVIDEAHETALIKHFLEVKLFIS